MRWDQGAAIESMRQNYEIHQVALLIEDKMDLPHRKVENKKMTKAERNKQKRHQDQHKKQETAQVAHLRGCCLATFFTVLTLSACLSSLINSSVRSNCLSRAVSALAVSCFF